MASRTHPFGAIRRQVAGFTLIEVGLVVGLLSLIVLAVADYYTTQLSLRASAMRVEGTVRDAQSIIDAALAWTENDADGHWPNDGSDIDIEQLATDGFLNPRPVNRFSGCPTECEGFALTGWDWDFMNLDGTMGQYTTDPMEADDLVLQFEVPGEAAINIANQLPLGSVTAPATAGDPYTVETRISAGFGRYVLLANEGRPVRFAEDASSVPQGRLWNVADISGGGDIGPTVGAPWIRLSGSTVLVDPQLDANGDIVAASALGAPTSLLDVGQRVTNLEPQVADLLQRVTTLEGP